MLHYKSKDWYIGDVHPYYEDDTLYLFYLKPNGIIRCDACFENPEDVVTSSSRLAVTKNYSDWEEYPLGSIIVNLVKLGDTYYCCRGSGEHAFYESKNLIDWQPCNRYNFDLDMKLFPAGARDYACFWDHDLGGIRTTMNAYFTNEHNGDGVGLECCVGISGIIEQGNPKPPIQRVLLPLDNTGRDLMLCMEPECNQMIYIGNRWYLLTSLARQTVHWVGPPSYWIGDPDTPIDQQNWAIKRENRLDGEDLCAAQIAENNGKFYIFGWIPLNYNGQEWGGHLNLPHEVYQLDDGVLASRLDPKFARSIIGDQTVHPLAPKYCESFGYYTETADCYTNFGVKATFDLKDAMMAGMIADVGNGVTVLLERSENKMRVVRMLHGLIVFEYSSMDIDCSEWNDHAQLHVIFDEDIIEAFLNDRYSLCARISQVNSKVKIGAFCSTSVGIQRLESYLLKRPD